jgi:hypothetical protein
LQIPPIQLNKSLLISNSIITVEKAMKFFMETTPLFNAQRRAHIAKAEPQSSGKCLCAASLNPEKWTLVEELPKDIHLCKKCYWLAEHPASVSAKP